MPGVPAAVVVMSHVSRELGPGAGPAPVQVPLIVSAGAIAATTVAVALDSLGSTSGVSVRARQARPTTTHASQTGDRRAAPTPPRPRAPPRPVPPSAARARLFRLCSGSPGRTRWFPLILPPRLQAPRLHI